MSKNSQSKPTLLRNLGRFFGEIGKAVQSDKRSDGEGARTVELNRTTETEERETERGTVTVRRTTIEEIELTEEQAANRPPDRS